MSRNSKTETGSLIARYAAAKGLNQSTLAAGADVSRPYVNRVVQGNELPTASWLDIVATSMGLSDEQKIELHRAAARDHGFKIDLS